MNFINLPDDLLILLFDKYLKATDLISVSKVCRKFYHIVNNFELCDKFLTDYPVIDLNYPYGKIV